MNVKDTSDRQLQEWIYLVLLQQEKHLRYFSTVLTIYLIITVVGLVSGIFLLMTTL